MIYRIIARKVDIHWEAQPTLRYKTVCFSSGSNEYGGLAIGFVVVPTWNHARSRGGSALYQRARAS
jgi:hypothetical protein